MRPTFAGLYLKTAVWGPAATRRSHLRNSRSGYRPRSPELAPGSAPAVRRSAAMEARKLVWWHAPRWLPRHRRSKTPIPERHQGELCLAILLSSAFRGVFRPDSAIHARSTHPPEEFLEGVGDRSLRGLIVVSAVVVGPAIVVVIITVATGHATEVAIAVAAVAALAAVPIVVGSVVVAIVAAGVVIPVVVALIAIAVIVTSVAIAVVVAVACYCSWRRCYRCWRRWRYRCCCLRYRCCC